MQVNFVEWSRVEATAKSVASSCGVVLVGVVWYVEVVVVGEVVHTLCELVWVAVELWSLSAYGVVEASGQCTAHVVNILLG